MFFYLKNFILKIQKKKRSLFTLLPVVFIQILKNEISYVVKKKNIILTLFCLKLHVAYQYKVLSCISCVDYLETALKNTYRFSIVYDLLSLIFNTRVKIKIFINELSPVFSSTSAFVNSNWWEREIWDMFGVWFENHPDLRRILTDYGFDGFPLRKDFPLVGYFEVIYDIKKKRIRAKPCEFSQEFRTFNFEDTWD